MWHINVILND